MAAETATIPSSTAGVAVIKAEFIYHAEVPKEPVSGEPEAKRVKLDTTEKKKARGQNKGRFYHNKTRGVDENNLCNAFIDVREGEDLPTSCKHPNCKFTHDLKLYISQKPPDIGPECYVFKTLGHCRRGATCRFGSQHLTEDGRNKVSDSYNELNKNEFMLKKDLQFALRKKAYNFDKANGIVDKTWNEYAEKKKKEREEIDKTDVNKAAATGENTVNDAEVIKAENPEISDERHEKASEVNAEAVSDKVKEENVVVSDVKQELDETKPETIDNVNGNGDCRKPGTVESVLKEGCSITDKLSLREKKKIDWKGKLYLAPLTTLGNLPFRRVCKKWGADITCGEMAMATQILQGATQEWALLRRHESEDLFGVQICGNNPHILSRCSQLIEEATDVDFIDLNLGCPIELVYKSGGGSGLLRSEKQLYTVVNSMARVTNIPFTVKTRSGIYQDKKVAHTHMPLYNAAGVSLIVVHGRTREQRYTRTADWDYIEDCASRAGPTPVFGNGDVLSFSDYNHVMTTYPHVAGVMIGRGALLKPWIFTEIKEQRDWDISSSERLDILKKFTNYGLEHWGSDTKGVENTRRFLLEWLSFLYRYIPVGLLERPPQRINERPPRYVGRNDLETLMASPNCANWIKISEMLCGPVPEGFQFLPKHKANSWGG